MSHRQMSGMKRSESDLRTDEANASFPRHDSFHRNESIASYGDDVPVRLGKGTGSKSRLMNTWSALSPSTERGIGKKLLKAYHRTRRDYPLVNFMVVYGVKQAGAALFLADIISDILVTGAFIRKANLAEICEPYPNRARAIAAFSLMFILIPLVLTALFITRVHIRGYVRRKQLQEMQKTLQGTGSAGQPFLTGGDATVADTSQLPDIYTANLTQPMPAPSYFDGGGMSAVAQPRPRADGASQHTLRMPQAETPRSYTEAPHGFSMEGSAFYTGPPPQSSPRPRPSSRRSPGTAVAEGLQPVHTAAVYVPPEGGVSGLHHRRNLNVEMYVGQSSLLAGGDASPRQDMATALGPKAFTMPAAAVDIKALEREALWTAVVSFPLMVMAAVGLDVALVIVSLVPHVAFFIGFESIMPAYYAYRLLVEVVLEAVPQVVLQLIALRLEDSDGRQDRRDGDAARKGHECSSDESIARLLGRDGDAASLTEKLLYISIGIACLNLVKTLVVLYVEASGLRMGLLQYTKYLMEVGSTRLPLKGIVDDTVGQRLQYEAANQRELSPLFAAIQKNSSLRLLAVSKMQSADVVELVRLLEVRGLPYSLDISESAFTSDDYLELLLLLLRSRFVLRVAFRACHTQASPWVRHTAFVFLRLRLPGGCVDDGLLPHASAKTDPKEEAELASRLIDEWLRPCHVMKLHNSQRTLPTHESSGVALTVAVEVTLAVPQQPSMLVAALHFLAEHTTLAALECNFALHPEVLAMLLRVLAAQSKGVSKLRLAGTRCALDDGAARYLEQVLAGSPGMRRLALTRFWGDQTPPRAVFQALEGCKKLGELALTGNRLGTECCAVLGRVLPGLPMLKKVALDACFLDDAAAAALAGAWPRGPNRKHLPSEIARVSIGGNQLSPTGIAALATCFACCRKLEEVDVSCTPHAAELPAHIVAATHGDQAQYDHYAWLDHEPQEGSSRRRSMIVWDADMVAALAPLLRAAHCVRSHGCAWTGSALRELLSLVNCNPSLQLLLLRQNEAAVEHSTADGAQVTLSHVFRNLQARAEATKGAASMLSLDVVGVAAGGMARAEREAKEVVRTIANLNIACPEIDASSKAAPAQMAQFANVLGLVPHVADLRQLKLRAPCATAAGQSLFTGAPGSTRRLATLHLSSINLGHPNVLATLSAVPGHPLSQVEDLALRGCFLGDAGAAALGTLAAHMPRLRSLALSDNNITRAGTGALVKEWDRAGRAPDTLVTLDLSCNPIGIEGARDVGQCLGRLTRLQVLRLSHAELGSRGATALSEAMQEATEAAPPGRSGSTASAAAGGCADLRVLDLEGNDIGDSGGEDLADALRVLPALQVLKLMGNRPAFEGTQALLTAAALLPALQVLTLGDGGAVSQQGVPVIRKPVVAAGLTWEGAVLLMTKLQHMHGLRELRLPGLGAPLVTGFMDGVVARLADALRALPALQVLDVRGLGQLSAAAAATLAASVAASPALEVVDVSGSSVGPAAVDILRAQGRQGRVHMLLSGAT
eukprot:jgi/Ulvmu1/2589/UM014_0040.1